MPSILIVYYSRSGNTEKLAEAVAEGARSVDGVEVELKAAGQISVDELLEPDGIIMGSPVYFGTMAAELKQLIDESVKHFGKLEGKVGGAFTTSGAEHGGNETCVLDITKALMIHGMIVKGRTASSHYGAIAVGAPDEQALEEGRAYGKDVAELVLKLAGC